MEQDSTSNIVDIYEVDIAFHASRHVTKLLDLTCRTSIKMCKEREERGKLKEKKKEIVIDSKIMFIDPPHSKSSIFGEKKFDITLLFWSNQISYCLHIVGARYGRMNPTPIIFTHN